MSVASDEASNPPRARACPLQFGLATARHLDAEVEWIWIEDVACFDYVRVDLRPTSRRVGKPSWKGRAGRCVGYAELRPDVARTSYGGWERRVAWLADHDRDSQPEGV